MQQSRSPLELVEALGLTGGSDFAELANRDRGFHSVHLGLQDVGVGTLLDLLQTEPLLNPPRTGHLGNWSDIARGRAGALDFNQAICAQGYGYPLIYCFTQTEAEADGVRAGDWVYVPGSLISDRGERVELPLFSWDGQQFAPRGRERALFCPSCRPNSTGACSR